MNVRVNENGDAVVNESDVCVAILLHQKICVLLDQFPWGSLWEKCF